MLSIFIASPLVTLANNSLVNFPMHYFFLRLKLREHGVMEKVSIRRMIRSAVYSSFQHWLVVLCSAAAVYIFVSTFWVLSAIDGQNGFAYGQKGSFVKSKTLNILVLVNLAFNFVVGMVTSVLFLICLLISRCMGRSR